MRDVTAARWSLEPSILIPLVAVTAVYVRGTLKMRGPRRAAGGRKVVAAAALVISVLALLSPLHELGERSLSAHMLQHILLMTVIPLLVVWARPGLTLWVGLPSFVRRPLRGLRAETFAGPFERLLKRPIAAFVLQSVALWVWHLPSLYDAAVRSDALHGLEHATFLGTGLLFWAAIFERDAKGAIGGRLAFVLFTALEGSALGAIITFAPRVLYRLYGAIPGSSPLSDQRLAGLEMWIPGGLLYLAAAGYLFARWLKSGDERPGLRGLAVPPLLIALLMLGAACDRVQQAPPPQVPNGDPQRGMALIQHYDCGSCHVIPGVDGATGTVGPPLTQFAKRGFIAGELENNGDNLSRWIQDPKGVEPKTDMPDLGVTPQDAEDIAAYLFTLD
jgi:putative membrane protein